MSPLIFSGRNTDSTSTPMSSSTSVIPSPLTSNSSTYDPRFTPAGTVDPGLPSTDPSPLPPISTPYSYSPPTAQPNYAHTTLSHTYNAAPALPPTRQTPFHFKNAWRLWRDAEVKKEELADSREKNKNGKKVTFKVNGKAVSRSLWGILERADGTPAPPEVYDDVRDLIYLILDEFYEDGKLHPQLVQNKLTMNNWREIIPRFDRDFPEFRLCSADWKIKTFFTICMPSWKLARGHGDPDSNGGSKRKSNSVRKGK